MDDRRMKGGGDRDRIWGDWRWTDHWSEKVQESQHLHTLIPPQSFSVWQTAHCITLRTHMRTVTIQDNSLEIWTNTFQQNYPSILNNWFQNKTKKWFFFSKHGQITHVSCPHYSLQLQHACTLSYSCTVKHTHTDALIQIVTCFLFFCLPFVHAFFHPSGSSHRILRFQCLWHWLRAF